MTQVQSPAAPGDFFPITLGSKSAAAMIASRFVTVCGGIPCASKFATLSMKFAFPIIFCEVFHGLFFLTFVSRKETAAPTSSPPGGGFAIVTSSSSDDRSRLAASFAASFAGVDSARAASRSFCAASASCRRRAASPCRATRSGSATSLRPSKVPHFSCTSWLTFVPSSPMRRAFSFGGNLPRTADTPALLILLQFVRSMTMDSSSPGSAAAR
mmetsp:Transcript_33996/g.95602  ORF Transcript_33996/g.95602 Transcript_33996/m.95602 type:complete len:213 (+) Transcript_33996:283-921(+)